MESTETLDVLEVGDMTITEMNRLRMLEMREGELFGSYAPVSIVLFSSSVSKAVSSDRVSRKKSYQSRINS